jgi:hypothetical protein
MRLRLLLALLASSAVTACEPTGIISDVQTAEITISTDPSPLLVGGTRRLTVVTRNRAGRRLNRPFLLSSSDVTRATVSNDVVTGVVPGPVRITAQSDGRVAETQIVVQPAPSR